MSKEADKNRVLGLEAQVILYRLNDKKEVDYIDTAYHIDSDGSIVGKGQNEDADNTLICFHDGYDDGNAVDSAKTLHYRQAAKIFTHTSGSGEQVAVKSNTLRMEVPKVSADGDDVDFWVYGIDSIGNDDNVNIRAYKKKKDNIAADVILTYRDTSTAYEIPGDFTVSIVDKLTNSVNEDGDYCYKLTGFTDGRAVSYLTQDDGVVDNLTLNGEKYYPKKGDVVRLSTNQFGELHAIEPIYSLEKNALRGNENPSSDSVFSGFRVQIAYVYNKSGGFIQTTTTTPEAMNLNDTAGLANYEVKNLDNYNIYIYDSSLKTVSIGTTDAIVGFKNSGGIDASKIFLYERYGDGRTLVIYQ